MIVVACVPHTLTLSPPHTLTHPQAVVWDVRHCSHRHTLTGHHGAVFAVELSDSTTTAFTGSGDKVRSNRGTLRSKVVTKATEGSL